MQQGILKATTSKLYYHEKIIHLISSCEVKGRVSKQKKVYGEFHSWLVEQLLLISWGFGWYFLLSLSLFHQDLLSLGLVLEAQLPQLEIGLNVAQLSIENIFNIEKNICFPTQGKLISFLPWPFNWIPFIDFEFKEAQSEISFLLKCQECTISFLENVRRYVFGLC